MKLQIPPYTSGLMGAVLFSTFSLQAAAQSGEPPNIIVVLTDDQGYHDVGFTGGQEIPTPNIDRIAENGVHFTHGYVSYAVSSPSRAGLITGRYQDRFGHARNAIFAPEDSTMGLPTSEQTLADVLGPAGYKSMAIGKWHLGSHEVLHPLSRGFDEFYGFLSGGHRYFPDELTIEDISDVEDHHDGYFTKLLKNHTRVEETEYLTDAFSREAIDFVEQNADGPFFLYLAYNAPHTPLQATEKYLSRFDHMEDEKRQTYAAMVSAVDDGVGGLLDKLRELGIEENTLVFFLSDNGGPEDKNASDNGPLRAGKGSLYEGGIHVPFAVQWPGHLPQGMVYEKPVISLDIFATSIALAGVSPDPERPIDGVDLMPYLTGSEPGNPHDCLFWRKFDQQKHAVRKDSIKLKDWELFNLYQDLSETTDLSDEKPQVRDELQNKQEQWESEMIDPQFLGLRHLDAYWYLQGMNPVNCLVDGDFESGNISAGWFVPSYSKVMLEEQDTYEGAYTAKIQNGAIRQKFAVEPGRTYQVSFSGKWLGAFTNAPDWFDGLTMRIMEPGNKDNEFVRTNPLHQQVWQTVVDTMTIPEDIEEAELLFWRPSDIPAVLVDHVSVTDTWFTLNTSDEITEGSEDGKSIAVDLQGDTWAETLTPGNWSAIGFPQGVTIGAVNRINDQKAEIILEGNAETNYDVHIQATLSVDAAELVGWNGDPVTTLDSLQFKATRETGWAEGKENKLNVFPNPVAHAVQIEAERPIEKIMIYSLQGELLRQYHHLNRPFISISTKNLNSGIYILRIHDVEGLEQTRKIYVR